MDRAWLPDVPESGIREKLEIIWHVGRYGDEKPAELAYIGNVMFPACCCTSGGFDECASKFSGKESSVLDS